jgi:hypothetical protein
MSLMLSEPLIYIYTYRYQNGEAVLDAAHGGGCRRLYPLAEQSRGSIPPACSGGPLSFCCRFLLCLPPLFPYSAWGGADDQTGRFAIVVVESLSVEAQRDARTAQCWTPTEQ